jgi:hypothetical protein
MGCLACAVVVGPRPAIEEWDGGSGRRWWPLEERNLLPRWILQ